MTLPPRSLGSTRDGRFQIPSLGHWFALAGGFTRTRIFSFSQRLLRFVYGFPCLLEYAYMTGDGCAPSEIHHRTTK